jgi:lipid-A-disaccharide synthase-like uncharacterized protein
MLRVDVWTVFGFFAQFIFFLRFVIQWYASERHKKSVIPMGFWYLSILGAVLICIYAIVRRDIVFIVSTILSLGIYGRNIILRKSEKAEPAP